MGGKVLDYEAKTILNEGIEKGIKGTVSILKNLGVPLQTIIENIREEYGLSLEASQKYVK